MNKKWAFVVTLTCMVLAAVMLIWTLVTIHPVAPEVNTDGPAVYEVEK